VGFELEYEGTRGKASRANDKEDGGAKRLEKVKYAAIFHVVRQVNEESSVLFLWANFSTDNLLAKAEEEVWECLRQVERVWRSYAPAGRGNRECIEALALTGTRPRAREGLVTSMRGVVILEKGRRGVSKRWSQPKWKGRRTLSSRDRFRLLEDSERRLENFELERGPEPEVIFVEEETADWEAIRLTLFDGPAGRAWHRSGE